MIFEHGNLPFGMFFCLFKWILFLKILLEVNSRRSEILDLPQNETLDQSLITARQFCYLEKEIITHASGRDIKKNGMEKSLPGGKCPCGVCLFCSLLLLTETLHDRFVSVLASVACKHSFSPLP